MTVETIQWFEPIRKGLKIPDLEAVDAFPNGLPEREVETVGPKIDTSPYARRQEAILIRNFPVESLKDSIQVRMGDISKFDNDTFYVDKQNLMELKSETAAMQTPAIRQAIIVAWLPKERRFVVLDGNTRVMVARHMDIPTVPVCVINVEDPDEQRLFAFAANHDNGMRNNDGTVRENIEFTINNMKHLTDTAIAKAMHISVKRVNTVHKQMKAREYRSDMGLENRLAKYPGFDLVSEAQVQAGTFKLSQKYTQDPDLAKDVEDYLCHLADLYQAGRKTEVGAVEEAILNAGGERKMRAAIASERKKFAAVEQRASVTTGAAARPTLSKTGQALKNVAANINKTRHSITRLQTMNATTTDEKKTLKAVQLAAADLLTEMYATPTLTNAISKVDERKDA